MIITTVVIVRHILPMSKPTGGGNWSRGRARRRMGMALPRGPAPTPSKAAGERPCRHGDQQAEWECLRGLVRYGRGVGRGQVEQSEDLGRGDRLDAEEARRRPADPGNGIDLDRRREVGRIKRERDPVALTGLDARGARLGRKIPDLHRLRSVADGCVSDSEGEAAGPSVAHSRLHEATVAHSDHVSDDDTLRGAEGVTERGDGAITLGGYLQRTDRERAECDRSSKEASDDAGS